PAYRQAHSGVLPVRHGAQCVRRCPAQEARLRSLLPVGRLQWLEPRWLSNHAARLATKPSLAGAFLLRQNQPMNANLKVYKDIICLEVPTPHGPKWWWQSGNLAYTPCHISLIQEVKQATVSNKGNMLTVPVRIDGRTV